MAGKIRILSEFVVNQIAAGEVIDRAASALKELIENSIDAGAGNIRITLKGHGTELIQVSDDGVGMTRADLHLAFERHATSKLSSADDLRNIHSYGFRGEALPSIASVSLLEARSRSESESSGTMLRFESGEVVLEEPVAMPPGTTISVHSLFYNTPARAAFLKAPATELAHLVRVFRNYAIACPHISWSLTHGTTLETVLPAASFQTRLEDLFGSGFSAKLIDISFDQAGIKLSGVVGKEELNKKSRGDQFSFLNSRPIQSAFLHSAFKAALKERLDPGEWPFYVLMLNLDPASVDVNVHPAKLEVRFRDERAVHAAVYRAVRAALPAELIPAAATADSLIADEWGRAAKPSRASSSIERSGGLFTPTANAPERSLVRNPPLPFVADAPRAAATARDSEPHSIAEREALFRPNMLQVHQKYLIAQIRSGVAIVDQHAAHERILYEKALRSFEDRSFNSQQLLFPLLLELNTDQDALFAEIRGDLSSLGFQISPLGPRSYSVEAVPAGLRRASESEMICAMIDEYSEFRRANFAPRDALAAGFACKAAIRTGDPLTSDEMIALVDELFATNFPNTCPHGRPTVIHLPLGELDRRFKRTD